MQSWTSAGGGRAAIQFAKMGKEERKNHREAWKARVKYNSRRIIEIIISSFERLPGEALRSVNPKYNMMEWPPRLRYATRPGTSCGRRCGDTKTARRGPRRASPRATGQSKSRQITIYETLST